MPKAKRHPVPNPRAVRSRIEEVVGEVFGVGGGILVAAGIVIRELNPDETVSNRFPLALAEYREGNVRLVGGRWLETLGNRKRLDEPTLDRLLGDAVYVLGHDELTALRQLAKFVPNELRDPSHHKLSPPHRRRLLEPFINFEALSPEAAWRPEAKQW